jgi:hypothetical protein
MKGTNVEMQIHKISDYCSANQIVARCSMQKEELCSFFFSEKGKKIESSKY